ncbi:MAG: hypothetical protein ABH804_01570 [archaeon]
MEGVINLYKEFLSFFPPYVGVLLNLLILTLIIVVYSVFVWKFYRIISKKNTIELNLNQYNINQNSFFSRLFSGAFYFLENIIIAPLLIFIAFAVFTFFLIALSENQDVSQILVVSAVVIAAIRMTSYYKEDLSKDLAKMFPFLLLTIAVLNPANFSQAQYFEKIIFNLSQLPNFFGEIIYYLGFIIFLEIIMRFFDFLFSLFGIEEVGEEKKN